MFSTRVLPTLFITILVQGNAKNGLKTCDNISVNHGLIDGIFLTLSCSTGPTLQEGKHFEPEDFWNGGKLDLGRCITYKNGELLFEEGCVVPISRSTDLITNMANSDEYWKVTHLLSSHPALVPPAYT